MLVKAQCTNCNGVLEVDQSKDAAVCPYCGTAYVVEKAIQQFNTTNNNYIQNATINMSDSEETIVDRAITQLKLKEYTSAEESIKELTKRFPGSYKGWLLNCIIESEKSGYLVPSIIDNVNKTAPDHIKEQLGELKICNEKTTEQAEANIDAEKMRMHEGENDGTYWIIVAMVVLFTIAAVALVMESFGVSIVFGILGAVLVGALVSHRNDNIKRQEQAKQKVFELEDELKVLKESKTSEDYYNIIIKDMKQ